MRKPLFSCGLLLLFTGSHAYCAETFDLSLLEKTQDISRIDASYFNTGNDLLPGEYNLSVIINGESMGNAEITVKFSDGKVQPVFTPSRLRIWGINTPASSQDEAPLSRFITPSQVDADLGENALTITVPQQYWRRPARYDVARSGDWDDGINAAFSNYAVHYDNAFLQGTESQQAFYGNFENGININGYQLRNNGFLNWQNGRSGRYTSSTSYLRRDIDALRGTLTAGDFYTSGIFFSGLSLRGVALTSNIGMFSASERMYAPAIVGVAQSNATVVVRQNGYVIATRKVTPGPFTLRDIPAAASAGDLEFTIHEASGAQRTFYQPYNTVDMLVPAGVLRYEVYSGRSRMQRDKKLLTEVDARYGLSNAFTLLGGAQYSGHFAMLAAGAGANLPWPGALYALINSSRREGNGRLADASGNKVRLGYARYLTSTRSYIYATLERKLSRGYSEFEQNDGDTARRYGDYQQKLSLQLSQNTPAGNAVLNFTRQNNWNGSTSHALRGSLNMNVSRYTLITSVGHQKNGDGTSEQIVSLTLSVPLNEEMNHYLTLSRSQSGSCGNNQLAASGTLLEDSQLGYNFTATSGSGPHEFNGTLDYLSSHGQSSGAYRSSGNEQQLSLGMEGAVLAHRHGLTFSQRLGSSAALIHTDNVRGLKLENNQNVLTDRNGNAVAPDLVPYHYNEEALFNESGNPDINVSSDVITSAPRQGAIVEMDFAASYQKRHYARVVDTSGHPVPFGSVIYDSGGNSAGMVSAGGMALVRVPPTGQDLSVKMQNRALRCVLTRPDVSGDTIWKLRCH